MEVVGWVGQALYFSRFLIQWYLSERARKIVVPSLFWWLSIAGAFCSGLYAFHKGELVFLISPVINLFVHGRNIALLRTNRPMSKQSLLPVLIGMVALVMISSYFWDKLKPSQYSPFWLFVGGIGQFLWTSRFPLQWYLSERSRNVTLGAAFFWVSFFGSVLLLAVALKGGNPIFIAGYALGPILYGRNLILSARST
jgi:lipid-A-disaccharide synthase-like uncharacterized protein